MRWRKARKKPIIIEFREVEGKVMIGTKEGGQSLIGEEIKTAEGTLYAVKGRDFIIKGIRGEIYPINKAIFEETYEVLEEGS